RTKGEAGTGDIVEAVRHMRAVNENIRRLEGMPREEIMAMAKEIGSPCELLCWVAEHRKLPVVNFAAGGVATPADAALMMQLGADGVFVGSGIFKSDNPTARAEAIVRAVANYEDATLLAEISKGLGEAMKGIDVSSMADEEKLQNRGW
ncbi:MAG: pyridoxal 5'-phosphate synthase lyase subunit PdxS, partial [Bacillota bacterium]